MPFGKSLVRDLALRDVEEKPLPIPAFTARLNSREVRALSASDQVVSVTRVYPDKQIAEFSGWSDRTDENEIIPWGKRAVGADDDITVSDTRFFLVDGPYKNTTLTALADEINLISTEGDQSSSDFFDDHAPAVISLAAGKRNNSRIRGINPGQRQLSLRHDRGGQYGIVAFLFGG